MLFSNSKQLQNVLNANNIKIGNNIISQETSTKILGITIDEDLNLDKLDDSAFLRTQSYITEICYFEVFEVLNFG